MSTASARDLCRRAVSQLYATRATEPRTHESDAVLGDLLENGDSVDGVDLQGWVEAAESCKGLINQLSGRIEHVLVHSEYCATEMRGKG